MLWRPHFRKEFDHGTLLQHAVYAEAARNILGAGAQVGQSSYYFCTEKGRGELVRKSAQLDPGPVLTAISEAMGAGTFIRGSNGSGCNRCDYQRACPQSEIDRASFKTDDAHGGVNALRRLAQYD
jgi:hypothetical protein